eukprot:TRINITY_DN7541_c0_g1_i5.p1 TRINITY_DN7541_c0_g1~~TRINITY_DN7541_c0_g1_i5.p1  ORF type:complete len:164 (-),score=13.56 TRINITY_DN7541_c0_g1_i5:261-752(-)
MEALRELRVITCDEVQTVSNIQDTYRRIFLRFLLSPLEFLKSDDSTSRLSAIKYGRNRLVGKEFVQKAEPNLKAPNEVLPCDLLLRSIGYGTPLLEGLLHDDKEMRVPNSNGCILSEVSFKLLQLHPQKSPGFVEVGLYVSGWAKNGAKGVVDSSFRDSIVKN